jgi:hypothetical protein
VREARETDASLRVDVIGFAVGDEEARELGCVAQAGGGRYRSADDGAELGVALEDLAAAGTRGAPVAPPLAAVPASPQSGAGDEEAASPQSGTGDAQAASPRPVAGAEGAPSGHPAAQGMALDAAGDGGRGHPGDEPAGAAAGAVEQPVAEAGAVDPAAPGPAEGSLRLTNSSTHAFVHAIPGGERVGLLSAHGAALVLAEGRYELHFENVVLPPIRLRAGEDRVVDLSRHVGWIALEGSTAFARVVDGETGRKLAFLGPEGEFRQVPAGSWDVQFDNFVFEDVEVPAGERVRLDVTGRMGWLALGGGTHYAHVFAQASGRKVAILRPGGEPVQVPAGVYRIKSQGESVAEVFVQAGELILVE